MIKTLVLVSALVGTAGLVNLTAASAQTLHPIRAETIELGSAHGSAYFVPKSDGYHIVATLTANDTNAVVRFNAVLAKGQSASISVPGPIGAPAREVTFERTGDELLVRQSPETVIATQ